MNKLEMNKLEMNKSGVKELERTLPACDAAPDIMRRPNRVERNNPGSHLSGAVTNWKQCAIIGLTPMEVMAVRGGSGNKATVATALTKVRKALRQQGWVFPLNPCYDERDLTGRSRPFLRALPPAPACCEEGRYAADLQYTAEIQQAECTWQAEVARQTRSNWGTRLRPGKAAGS